MKRFGIWTYLLMFILTLFTFQNCGDVKLSSIENNFQSSFKTEEPTYFNILPTAIEEYRAVVVIDMSNSMFSGACPDSVDTMIDNVNPVGNCLAPSGADPDGNRFKVILKWLNELDIKIADNLVKAEKIKLLILPFSVVDSAKDISVWSVKSINKRTSLLGYQIPEGFMSVDMARKYLFFLWALEAKYHELRMNDLIPLDIRNTVETNGVDAGNVNASTGTSVISPSLDLMNSQLLLELAKLKTTNLLNKSVFTLNFFSDGVPKPHPAHIEAAIKYIWNNKTKVCDSAYVVSGQGCSSGFNTDLGWMTVTGGSSCSVKCGDQLKSYVDSGSANIPAFEKPLCTAVAYSGTGQVCTAFTDGTLASNRWGSKISCDLCFELVRQFDFTKGLGYSYPFSRDMFKFKTETYWGSWLLNKHSNIIDKLKTAINIFKFQYPEAILKMGFVRLDSADIKYKTSAGELNKNINWIERAKDYFAKNSKFSVLINDVPPFSLFSMLNPKQNYTLGMFYVYNKSFKADYHGDFEKINTVRSDGVCLDIIKSKFSGCITQGCNPKIDFDGDGLNECEEMTLGTDDKDPDSDGDGLLDGSEFIYGMNPLSNDRLFSTNSDGFNNFDHFIKGYSPLINLLKIPSENQILINVQEVDHKTVKDNLGNSVVLPGYNLNVRNIPIEKMQSNEIVVVARVDNMTNTDEKIWLSHIYVLPPGVVDLQIRLEDLTKLNLVAP